MSRETTTSGTTTADEGPITARPRAGWAARAIRLAAVAVPIAVVVTIAMVLPGWMAVMPTAVRRALFEAVLRGVLIGYWMLVLAAVVGTPLMVYLAARSR